MYDIRPSYNAKSVKAYLGHDEPGIDVSFGGMGFDHLGVDPEDMTLKKFNKLIDNCHPVTNEPLTPRNKEGRICGWYITLSPPKDVTLMAEFSPQAEAVQRLLREAGDHVMNKFLQPRATVRDRAGVHGDRETGNLFWARLHHTTDRPHEGVILPQHHLHYFVPNATFDETRNRWFATKLRNGWWESAKIKRQFHKHLRDGLERDLGVKTKGFGMRWRIVGIDRDLVDRFSPRGRAIQAKIVAGVSRAFASLSDREDKVKLSSEGMRKLKASWFDMLTDRDKLCLNNLVARPKWGKRLHPGRRHLDVIRDLVPARVPEPLKGADYELTR